MQIIFPDMPPRSAAPLVPNCVNFDSQAAISAITGISEKYSRTCASISTSADARRGEMTRIAAKPNTEKRLALMRALYMLALGGSKEISPKMKGFSGEALHSSRLISLAIRLLMLHRSPGREYRDHDAGHRERPRERARRLYADERKRHDPQAKARIYPLLPHTQVKVKNDNRPLL